MKNLMFAALAVASFASFAAGPFENAVLHGETDKARALVFVL